MIVTDGSDGDSISLVLTESGDEIEAKKQAELPDLQPEVRSQSSNVWNHKLYLLDEEGFVSSIDLMTGTEEYRLPLKVSSSTPASISFENSVAYVVVSPAELDNQQAVIPIDLLNPECQGAVTPLIG